MNGFYRSVDGLSHLCGKAAGMSLLLLGPIAFYEVVMRKMGQPTNWTFHILGYIQIYIIWFGLADVQTIRGHVSVDLVTRLLPLKMQLIARIISTSLCLVLSAVLSWQGWRMVFRSYTINLMTTEELHHPVYWIQIPVVIGAAVLFLVLLRQNISDIRYLVTGEGNLENMQSKG